MIVAHPLPDLGGELAPAVLQKGHTSTRTQVTCPESFGRNETFITHRTIMLEICTALLVIHLTVKNLI